MKEEILQKLQLAQSSKTCHCVYKPLHPQAKEEKSREHLLLDGERALSKI